jgi:uncharacterized Zn finger protein
MYTILQLTTDDAITKHATLENIEQGKKLAAGKHVKLQENLPQKVRAHIAGLPGRDTQLLVTDKAFTWGCTCNERPDQFCKHLVATIVALRQASQ